MNGFHLCTPKSALSSRVPYHDPEDHFVTVVTMDTRVYRSRKGKADLDKCVKVKC